MTKVTKLLVAALLLAGSAVPARAAVIYNNGGPNLAGANEATQWIQANDFTLTTAVTLEDFHFWTLESATGYTGSVTYRIYANAAGQPDETNILQQGTISPTRAATGNSAFGLQDTSTDALANPIALGPGTYWLGLHNGPLTTTQRMDVWEDANSNGTLRPRKTSAPSTQAAGLPMR